LRSFLERDRLYAAYALCDLDEREFGRTRWGIAFDGEDAVAVALEYAGLAPQPVFVMGENAGVGALLSELIRPRDAYLAARTEHLPAIGAVYRIEPGPAMVRMWVDRSMFRPCPAEVARLGNVMTHPDFRGRGYATAVTGAVTADLLRFCDQVVLNVRSDNPPALQAYAKLGYREHVRFEERLIHRQGGPAGPLAALPGPIRRLLGRSET
jgi:ribosomal protein S18 acetylase RimI-like enzyme